MCSFLLPIKLINSGIRVLIVYRNVQVLHACYTKVSPSVQVDDPQLVAWSESVAELLDLDHKE